MAVPTAVGEYGSCQGTETRISPSKTSGGATPSAVASTTKKFTFSI